MSQAQDMPCPHDFTEREVAVADGHCPLCLAAALCSANERIQALQGGAERYWEGRWRDADAELRAAPSASAPDGTTYMHDVINDLERLASADVTDRATAYRKAAAILCEATRPPAAGQAWPSEDEVTGLIVEHIGYQGPILASATAHVICERFKYAAPPAQGSAFNEEDWKAATDCAWAQWKTYFVGSDDNHRTALNDALQHAVGILRMSVSPPAQGSAGWTPSDDDLRAGVRAFQSTPHGPDYLADWRAFYEAVRALAPPVEAQGSERMRKAAETVCWFDWSDNDEDACKAIDELRAALRDSSPATDK